MSLEAWRLRAEIFTAAVELAGEARSAYLDEACGGDRELRTEVERWLAADAVAGSFLEAGALDQAARELAAEGSPPLMGDGGPDPGHQIAGYRIERSIGSGGMGTVYLASRVGSGFRQEVAVKVLQGALALPEEIHRFHRERQILADLEHPAIARLYDGGTTGEGLPYIVMELVDGLPIDRHCDRYGLDVDARLRLFIEVCAAVAHAHRKLVVHLDLKPSNILVTPEGTPKLLDFGIARLMTPASGGSTAARLTTPWRRALTPNYASPELLRNEPLTTASDVYSLGVLLYRLLTGLQPYSMQDLTAAQIERRVCEGPSKPPSAMVAGAEHAPPGLARGKLQRRLRGDLDAVAMKALRPEAEQRYPSAEALAQDLRRELDGLPVSARRGAFAYRAGKFLRRHRAAVAAGLLIAMSLIASVILSARQARIASAERLKAERINEVLQGMLSAPDSSWYSGGSGHDVTMLEVLEAAGERLEGELEDVPEVEASVRATLGTTYLSLGLFDAAKTEMRRALALRRAALDEHHPDLAQSAFDLAVALRVAGRDLAEVESLYREALAICRAIRDCPPDLVPATLIELGLFMVSKGDEESGETHLQEAMGLLEARGEGSGRLAAIGWNNLGLLRAGQGDEEAAAAFYQRTIDILSALPEVKETSFPITLVNLAILRQQAGRDDEADALLEQARDYSRHDLGDNPYVAFLCAFWSAEFATRRGDLGGVLRHGAQAFAFAEAAAIDEQNLMLWGNHLNYGAALTLSGRLEDADGHLRQAMRILEGQLPDESWQYGATKSRLGANLAAQGERAAGVALLREGHEILSDALGPEHRRTRDAAKRLAAAGS